MTAVFGGTNTGDKTFRVLTFGWWQKSRKLRHCSAAVLATNHLDFGGFWRATELGSLEEPY